MIRQIDSLASIAASLAGIITKMVKKTAIVCLNRSEIDFNRYGKKVSRTYCVCGTSLKTVHEEFINTLLERNIDFKILLPDYDDKTVSYTQLGEYNKRKNQPYEDQVNVCENSYNAIKNALKNRGITLKDHLRLYPGIMFQNITIIDDHAFISFYDSTGYGDKNITIFCGKQNKALMKRIEGLFTDMWERAK
jgi:hypothetical protein